MQLYEPRMRKVVVITCKLFHCFGNLHVMTIINLSYSKSRSEVVWNMTQTMQFAIFPLPNMDLPPT